MRFLSLVALVADIIAPRYLKTILPLFDTFWSIGAILLATITYFVHTWRGIYLTITLPTIAYIALWYFLADSPQWHIRKGNISQATRIILEAAESNSRSSIVHGDFIEGISPHRFALKSHTDAGWLSLWKCNRNFINIVFVHLIWGAVLTNFNGMLLNTRNFGADTLNRNVALTGECPNEITLYQIPLFISIFVFIFRFEGVSELVGVLFAYTFIIGNARKWLWSGLLNIIVGFIVIFVFLISSARKSAASPNRQPNRNANDILRLISESVQEHSIAIMALNLTLKSVVSIAFVVIVSSTGELVGPKQRASLLMSCTIWGRICLLTASFIGSLSLFTTLLPLAVFAMNISVAGFLMCAINPNITNAQSAATAMATVKSIELHEMEKLTSQTEQK